MLDNGRFLRPAKNKLFWFTLADFIQYSQRFD